MKSLKICIMIALLVLSGCGAPSVVLDATPDPPPASSQTEMAAQTPSIKTEVQRSTPEESEMSEEIAADILSVKVTGSENSYQFQVKVSSPDTGCGQYADWWEILSEDGQLLYRRVLLHSHVTEQPFTRSGGPVAIDENAVVFVRAHMNTGGYGGTALGGSVLRGFESVELDPGFGADVEALPPLPEGCAF